jgi:gluconokinase
LPFIDADDLHSEANIAKMTRGEPLTDADRAPWLVCVRRAAVEAVECNARGVVVACSALKASYRQVLRGERANLKLDGCSRGDASGEATVTARDENPDRGQQAEEGRRELEGCLGTDEGIMVGASLARHAGRAPRPRTVFVHPCGAQRVLMERVMRRESHFMKAEMVGSQIAILENPGLTGESGIIEIRLEASLEEQVRAAVEGVGVRWGLPYM